jgi:hypothetical protein
MKKNNDNKGRFRNIIVAFRMSQGESNELNMRVKLSGLTKQDYLIKRSMEQEVVVLGNPRVYKALRDEMNMILCELSRVSENSHMSIELLDKIELIATIMNGLEKNDIRENR